MNAVVVAPCLNTPSMSNVGEVVNEVLNQNSHETEFSKVIKSIGRSTKRAAKTLIKFVTQRLTKLIKWLDEGAQMHNRQMALMNERYGMNPYLLR